MNMEIRELNAVLSPIRAAIFDFDGTISTLRCGWEAVMEKVMLNRLAPSGLPAEELLRRVNIMFQDYIRGVTLRLTGAAPIGVCC